LTEKAGLKLASALRGGAQSKLRQALAEAEVIDPKSEWDVLENAMNSSRSPMAKKTRGGRPQLVKRLTPVMLAGGGTLQAELSPDEVRIRVRFQGVSEEDAQELIEQIARHLG
ncbi:MAG: hypothetical protein ABJZ69_04585, partial [Hyphomicrobiales bacterium]